MIAFLRARLDEDEAAARALQEYRPGPWIVDTDSVGLESISSGPRRAAKGWDFNVIGEVWSHRIAEHVARWDPARVLAEVTAKRAIIDLHPSHRQGHGQWCSTCGDWPQPGSEQIEIEWPCPTLRALAQPYAEHADFDPAWRP